MNIELTKNADGTYTAKLEVILTDAQVSNIMSQVLGAVA